MMESWACVCCHFTYMSSSRSIHISNDYRSAFYESEMSPLGSFHSRHCGRVNGWNIIHSTTQLCGHWVNAGCDQPCFSDTNGIHYEPINQQPIPVCNMSAILEAGLGEGTQYMHSSTAVKCNLEVFICIYCIYF